MSYIFYFILLPFESCFGTKKSTENYKKYSDLTPEQLYEIFHPKKVKKSHFIKTAHYIDTHGNSHIYRRCSTHPVK